MIMYSGGSCVAIGYFGINQGTALLMSALASHN